jgi:mRNA interferase RelE/StbE
VSWTVRFTPAAQRQADSLDPPVRQRIANSLARLALDPHRAANVKALRGDSRYRLRVGDWRVIYTLEDDVLVVLVIRVGHRREVYD